MRVYGVERLAEPGPQGPYRVLGERAVAGDRVGERGPGDVTGRDPRHGRVGVGVQDRGGPLRAQPPRGLHLAAEPCPELLVQGEVGCTTLTATVRPPALRPR